MKPFSKKVRAGGIGAGALAVFAMLGLATPAVAAPVAIPLDCEAFLTPPPHVPGAGILVDGDAATPGRQPQIANSEIQAPASVLSNTEFTVTIPGGSTTLPATSSGFTVNNYTNLKTTYTVTGGTIVNGSLAASGPPLVNGSPSTSSAPVYTTTSIQIGTDGPIPGGATLASPVVTFKILSGGGGTTVQTFNGGTTLTANLQTGPIITPATANCNPPPNRLVSTPNPALSSTTVTDPPPPPGAPDAVPDTASTPQNNSVTIAVLANDIPNPSFAIAPSTLAVSTPTKSGALADPTSDNQIRYTPPIGFSGTDTFSYRICSVPNSDGSPGACDTAVVTVTVAGPPAAAATVAPAATLPVTGASAGGASTAWLAAFGSAILLAGVAMVLRTRTKRSRFVA